MSIWTKLIKIFLMEEELDMETLLDFFLARSKIFRLHAILHDSAGAVKTTTDQGPGYCYILPKLPSSCLFGHITGLFFCLYIKVCHPHIFKILDC